MRFLLTFLFLALMSVPAHAEVPAFLQALADQGNAGAEIAVGSLYLEGKGVAKNPVEADFWAMVAMKNSSDANIRRAAAGLKDKAEAFLSHAQKMDAQNRANVWKPKTAN